MMGSRSRSLRSLRVVLALAVLFAVQPISAKGVDGVLEQDLAVTRIPALLSPETSRTAGANRFETSVGLSREGWDTSEYVVIATARNWSDAIVGTSLAALLKAPVLLSEPNGVPNTVIAEIRRLGATKAIVLGGTATLSAKVVADLVGAGIPKAGIERIGGANRFETAANIGKRVAKLSDGQGWVAVVPGDSYEEALAVAPWAGALGVPIFLSERDTLPSAAAKAIKSIDPTATLVVGGTKLIGAKVFKKLPAPWRIAGADQYETAKLVAEFASDNNIGFDNVYVVRGNDWADALSAGSLAARTNGLIMLTFPSRVDNDTLSFFMSHCSSIDQIHFVGGEKVITEQVEKEILKAAETRMSSSQVVLVAGALRNSMTTVTSDTVSFTDTPLARDRIVTGRILVLNRNPALGSTDPLSQGLVRRVESVSTSGGQIVATTGDAAITEFIEKGSIDIDNPPLTADLVARQYDTEKTLMQAKAAGRKVAVVRRPAGILTKHFEDERNLWKNSSGTASLDSTVTVDLTIIVNFGVSIDWFSVDEMILQTYVSESLYAALGFTWEDQLEDKEFALATIPLGEFGFGIGPIDLGIGVQAKPVIGWEKVTGEFDCQFQLWQVFAGQLMVHYVDGKGTTVTRQSGSAFNTQFDAHGRATARPYVGLKVELVICGSDANTIYVMPDAYLWAQAEGEFHATQNFTHTSGQFDASLEFGVEARVGYAIDLLGLWSGSGYYADSIYDKTWTFGAGYSN